MTLLTIKNTKENESGEKITLKSVSQRSKKIKFISSV